MQSNSRYIDLLRIALLLEDADTLRLSAATPRGWLSDGQHLEVKRAPNYFGEVDFSARSQVGSGEIVFELAPPRWQAPNLVLRVCPPAKYGPLKTVKVNGKDWKDYDGVAVRLPRFSEKAKVVCGF